MKETEKAIIVLDFYHGAKPVKWNKDKHRDTGGWAWAVQLVTSQCPG